MDKPKPVLLLDVDGVLADCMSALLQFINENSKLNYKPEDIKQWDIFDQLAEKYPELKLKTYAYLGSPGFAAELKPYPEAILAVKKLKDIFDIYIVTMPFHASRTWTHERTEWLKKHYDIGPEKIIYTQAKHMVAGNIFVDDRPEFINSWKKCNPHGIAVLWEQTYNKNEDCECDFRLNNWNSIAKLLINY